MILVRHRLANKVEIVADAVGVGAKLLEAEVLSKEMHVCMYVYDTLVHHRQFYKY